MLTVTTNAFTLHRDLGTRRVTITADYIERLDAYLCVSRIDGQPHDYESTEEVFPTMQRMLEDAAVAMADALEYEKVVDAQRGLA